MIRPTFSALVGHWRRNPLQLFTLLAGLALATALWSGVQAINAEAKASYDAAAATLGEGQFDRLVRRDGQPISQQTYILLRRSGWLVSPVIEGRIDGVRVVGIEPLTAPGRLAPSALGSAASLAGFSKGQIIAAPETTLSGQIVTIDASIAPNTAIADIGKVQTLLDRPMEIDILIVSPEQPMRQVALATIAPELTVQKAQGGSDLGSLTKSFHMNLTAFGLLSFAVGIFIVHGAIGLAFEQRRGTVRTLRALGTPLRLLIILMGLELMALAIFAGVVGVGLGYLIAGFLLPDVAATLQGLYGADVSGALQLRPIWWISSLVIALGGTALAASGAFWKLSHLPLLAGAQPRALTLAARRGARWQAVAAICLLLIAAGLAVFANGIVAGFVLLAALLIGAALAFPLILSGVLTLASHKCSGTTASWFWADTRQQLPGLSLALVALLLAMAANVGVSTMVSSFRLTFLGFLDQRLSAELYIGADTPAQALLIETYAEIHADAVLPVQFSQVQVNGSIAEVYGYRDHPTYKENWRFLDGGDAPWAAIQNDNGALVSEQLARRANISVGTVIDVAGSPFEVSGIYGDYGNPIGQIVIAEHAFKDLFPEISPVRFGLRMAPDKVASFIESIEADIGVPRANTINQAGIKAFSLGVFDRTFTVTAALNVLTLAVAGFAILMSLLTLTAMRVPQLAPAWAMGMTRRKLGMLELLRTLLLAILTAVLALPLGLALAWVLLAVVNVAAFGWRLPMFLFPLEYARLGGFTVLAATVAALWPALRLARTPPSELLKVFSNER